MAELSKIKGIFVVLTMILFCVSSTKLSDEDLRRHLQADNMDIRTGYIFDQIEAGKRAQDISSETPNADIAEVFFIENYRLSPNGKQKVSLSLSKFASQLNSSEIRSNHVLVIEV